MSLDEIAPDYVGDDRIVVTLKPGSLPTAFQPFTVEIDYSACDPDGGIVLPVELFLRSPSTATSRIVQTLAPETWVLTPSEGGPHLVLVRELFHNRWWGRLRVQVTGDLLVAASAL